MLCQLAAQQAPTLTLHPTAARRTCVTASERQGGSWGNRLMPTLLNGGVGVGGWERGQCSL